MAPDGILKIAAALRSDLKAATKAGKASIAPLSLIIDDLQRRYQGYKPKYEAFGRTLSPYSKLLHIALPQDSRDRHEWIKENIENLRKGYSPDLASLLVYSLWDSRRDFLIDSISKINTNFLRDLRGLVFNHDPNIVMPSRGMPANYPVNFGFHMRDWEIAGQRIARERNQKTGHLSVAKLRIDSIPDSISDLKWLRRLNVSLLPISSIQSLETLEELEVLDCSYTELFELPTLPNSSSLKMIFCGVAPIASLEAVASCKAIERLHCGSTKVADLKPLRSCPELTILHCEDTPVSELAGLESCSKLRLLDCSDTSVKGLLPLELLPSLETLVLNGCHIEEHSPELWLLPSLKEVVFYRGSLKGIPAHILSRSFDENCLPRIRAYLGSPPRPQ